MTGATLRHAGWILRGNPLTGIAAAGVFLLTLVAIFGPWIVPYDPIVSDVPHALMLPVASARYTLEAASLLDGDVKLNGRTLALSAGDELPAIAGAPTPAATVMFRQATITFLAIPDAGNNACR